MKRKNKEPLTAAALLRILQSYRRMIEHDNGNFPTVVLDDIYRSITSILRDHGIQ